MKTHFGAGMYLRPVCGAKTIGTERAGAVTCVKCKRHAKWQAAWDAERATRPRIQAPAWLSELVGK